MITSTKLWKEHKRGFREMTQKTPAENCECGHGNIIHDEDGECFGSIWEYDKKKKVTGKHQCSCKKFKQKQKEIEK